MAEPSWVIGWIGSFSAAEACIFLPPCPCSESPSQRPSQPEQASSNGLQIDLLMKTATADIVGMKSTQLAGHMDCVEHGHPRTLAAIPHPRRKSGLCAREAAGAVGQGSGLVGHAREPSRPSPRPHPDPFPDPPRFAHPHQAGQFTLRKRRRQRARCARPTCKVEGWPVLCDSAHRPAHRMLALQ